MVIVKYIFVHCRAVRYIFIHCRAMRYIFVHCGAVRYIFIHCRAVRYIFVHCRAVRYIFIHCRAVRYTAGKISIEHVTIFLSKNISKGAIDMKFSPDVGNNQSNPYIQQINKTN